jgi:hypothetical protein
MLTDAQQSFLKKMVRVLQIIFAALVMGVCMFLGVVLLLEIDLPGEVLPDQPFLTYFAAGTAALAIVAWGVVPGMIAGRVRDMIACGKVPTSAFCQERAAELGDVGALGAAYQARAITGAAILEGAAFFNLVAYMIEAQPINVAAAVVLVVVMLAAIPTYGRAEAWVDHELTTIEQLRQMQTYDGR